MALIQSFTPISLYPDGTTRPQVILEAQKDKYLVPDSQVSYQSIYQATFAAWN